MTGHARPKVKPELEITSVQAQAIVDRIEEKQTVAQVFALHGGEIGAVYEIRLAGGAPSFVLKVYPETLHWKMRKEVFVSQLLQELSVPVPRIILADETKTLLGLNFVLMNKLDGDVLGRLEPMPADDLLNAYAQMGRALREIHRVPMDSFGYIGPNGVWTAYPSNRA